jgi:putative hydrolase of HD superfamily
LPAVIAAQATPEAVCAGDADKLETLLQAVEYRDVGVQRVDGWIDSARDSIRTATGRNVAEAALTTSPLAWRQG